jgi:hypothetical protein
MNQRMLESSAFMKGRMKFWVRSIVFAALLLVAALAIGPAWIADLWQDDFYVTDSHWDKGVARNWAGYYVSADSQDHAPGKLVKLKNGETRLIVSTAKNGPYLNVFVSGKPLDPSIHGVPREFTISDAPDGKIPDPFYLTDDNWDHGVARRWSGYFVPKGASGYSVGRRVRLKNGEVRAITQLVESGVYLKVYLEGAPLDPLVHGNPPDFIPE